MKMLELHRERAERERDDGARESDAALRATELSGG